MLEITKAQIRALNDRQLRELVGRLCEAELCRKNVPTSSVTWGGSHTAADGGSDVRVVSPKKFKADYVKKPNAVFQVKYPDLAPAAILKEMCPNGKIRPIIEELDKIKGAYIIASSGTDASDLVLSNRIKKMRSVASENKLTNLTVDYYDLQRLTSWVNQYLPVAIWVRDQIGEPVTGWKSYGNWSNSASDDIEPYLLDRETCIKHRGQGHDILRGIELIREHLHQPGSSVRLVGLSGVGKTKLVQTLFDDSIGQKVLNKELAIYTDMSNSPEPTPAAFCERIYSRKQRAIIIVDNCAPNMHETLTEICANRNGLISLLTVEYDIKDDQPEKTEVFQIDTPSEELLVDLLGQRFPQLDKMAREKIAHVAGGNARIGIAITNQIKDETDIPSMKSSAIFEKLFWQRGEKNTELLRAAEVMSLVYSFSIEDGSKQENELKVLAEIADISYPEMYRHMSELKKRDLIQVRSIWRAVLPHAIANQLAAQALDSIPIDALLASFKKSEHPRLLASFCHRLSYLHDNDIAVSLVESWLRPGGWLHDIYSYGSYETRIFADLAATAPQQIFEFIKSTIGVNPEKFTRSYILDREQFYAIIKLLAYEKSMFRDCATMLAHIALAVPNRKHSRVADTYLLPLFQLYASETQAQIDDKIYVIENLVESHSFDMQALGFSLLTKALDTRCHAFLSQRQFGSHLRGYGYWPKTVEDYQKWYGVLLAYVLRIAESNDIIIHRSLDQVISNSFVGLWYDPLLRQNTLKYILTLREADFFPRLWAQVDQTTRHYSKNIDDKVTETDVMDLEHLRKSLAPHNLNETFVASISLWHYSLYELGILPNDYSEAIKTLEEIGYNLIDQCGLTEGTAALCSIEENGYSTFHLGRGVASLEKKLTETWDTVSTYIDNMPKENLRIGFISGFTSKASVLNKDLYQTIIDYFINDKELIHYYPSLISSLSDSPYDMLLNSFESDGITAYDYWAITNTIDLHSWTVDQLKAFFTELLKKDEGDKVCVEIYSRIYNDSLRDGKLTSEQADIAHLLLSSHDYTNKRLNDSVDYDLAQMAKCCYQLPEQYMHLKDLINQIATTIQDSSSSWWRDSQLLEELAVLGPHDFLNCLLAKHKHSDIPYNVRYALRGYRGSSVLNRIKDNDILSWCDKKDTENRLLSVSYLIAPFYGSEDTPGWTDLALSILEKANSKKTVLEYYYMSFLPDVFTPPLYVVYEKKIPLVEKLIQHNDETISNLATEMLVSLKIHIEQTKTREEMEDKHEERFE